MQDRFIVKKSKNQFTRKDAIIFDDPAKLRPLLNPISWKILNLLTEKGMYPAEIARLTKIHEQKIYYHIRQLKKSGFLKVDREENIKGAVARFYRPTYPAMGVELPYGDKNLHFMNSSIIDGKLLSFFKEFIDSGYFNGTIVVGSPTPHGPYKTYSRDGHYAIQLAFFLGQFSRISERFVVKIDADVIAEKEEKNNLILIGGPGANLVTAQINKYLPIKFNEENYWAGLIDQKGFIHNTDYDGIIAKISNPHDSNKSIIVLAGLRAIGTKAAIIGITNFFEQVLTKFDSGRDWGILIRGFDMDGDGKVDSIEKIS